VVIFCETSKPTKWVIDQPPILRITGHRLPERDTIGRSRADRDYRMSRHDKALGTSELPRAFEPFFPDHPISQRGNAATKTRRRVPLTKEAEL
jgi:hypothetical protein